MKINLSTRFTDLKGNPILLQEGVALDMRGVLTTSLSMARSEMEPTRAWKLAKDISTAETDTYEIPVEEVAQIKTAIKGYSWVPMVIAQAFNALEGVSE
jgi:hypothetical protein